VNDIIFFSNPYIVALFVLALIFLILDITIKKTRPLFKILFAVSFTTAIILSLFYGIPYQEIIIVVMVFVVIALFYFYPPKKEDRRA